MPGLTPLMDGLTFTECPRWRDGRLYFSDFFTQRVLAVRTDGRCETVSVVPQQPGGLGWLPDGRMLIASMRDRKVLRREADGRLEVHADLWDLTGGHINDMLVDAEGRAWVGNFGFDLYGGAPMASTGLVCVEPDGTARVAAQDLGFPNGMAVTPDGKTLIVAETTMNRLSAFTKEGGVLGERRTWACFGPPPETSDLGAAMATLDVLPDGICLDEAGAVWIADPLRGRLLRVAEGGAVLEEVRMDGVAPFACILGGEDGRTLFVCAAPSFMESECVAARQAGVWMRKVEAGRAGLP